MKITKDHKEGFAVAIVLLLVIYFLFLRKGKDGKKQQLKPTDADSTKKTSNYIASPSGIEFTGCFGNQKLNYPYPFGYGGIGNGGTGSIPPSFADIYNSEIAGCEYDAITGRVRCMR